MSKKLLLLISFVLLFSLVGSASAAIKSYRVCWWSDLGPGHDWNEPNNWYTMDRFWDNVDDNNGVDVGEIAWYVKVHPNQVPDVNTVALVGKGMTRVYYPAFLHDNPPAFDPTISSGTVVASDLFVSGGYSLDPNKDGGGTQGAIDGNQNDSWWDPCTHHELTINGGTLNVGEPQTWDGYDTQYGDYGYFNGMWGGDCLRIGTVGWFTSELGPGNGQGTMNMNDGIVNVGGHMELGAWEQTIGTLNMTGGTINITQGLCCPAAPWGATARVNMSGGTINARYIFMNDYTSNNSGSIDIAGGKIILSRGNEVEELTNYSNGIGLGGAGVVSLTVYGGGHGDIVTDSNYGAAVGKRAALSIDFSVSNNGMTTVQAFLTNPNQAWAPSPPNGAGNVVGTIANIARPVLSWSPGDGATSHEVYFDANEALVSARNGSVRKQTLYDPCSWTVDSDLASLATYYWAIDENPGPTLGQVWSFTMANLSKAGLPSPGDGEVDVNPVVDLSWVAGIYASSHDVYFGTSFDDVNDATKIPPFDPNSVFMGNQVGNTFDTSNYDANGPEFSTTYYWRIDECNSAGVPLWPGDVWSFTTDDHIEVDDMDSYGPDPALRNVWKDYYSGSLNGKNGAELFREMSPDHVIDGNSMRYYYRNRLMQGPNPVGSEAEASTADLAVGTNWTVSGAEALVLYFQGDPANGQEPDPDYTILNDQMWVAVEDGDAVPKTGIVRYDTEHSYDLNDVKKAEWQEWNIDLQDPCLSDVNLANVAKMYIGFGGLKGGAGSKYGAGYDDFVGDTVWFDDIGLWPIRCVPAFSLATDFTGDCVVNEQDFDVMAGDWLITDYSTLGYTGTLTGFPGPSDGNYGNCWVTGTVDSNTALYFNLGGTPTGDEYVKIPPLNLNTNTMSITVWVKRHGLQRDDGGIFFCSWRDPPYGEGYGTTESGFVMGLGGDNSLNYNWKNSNTTYNWDPMIPVLPADEWAFCALTVAPVGAKIYIMPTSTGTIFSDENVGVTHDPEAFGIASRIGDHKTRRFVGTMDDFRIYDKTLTAGEIEFLAKLGASGDDPTDANLYAHYKFDDGGGLVALDDAGDMVNWWPVPSAYNLVDPEIEGERSVNFRDYVLLANDWLKEPTWPPRP